jgi:hypothetical protein
MNQWMGMALALAALILGGVFFGWQGVIVALSGVVFWLLMQFSRLMRVMRMAQSTPVGHVDSAVMLHAKLREGMRLVDVLPLTRSLGSKLATEPETWGWTDPGGVRLELVMENGRLKSWQLLRPEGEDAPAGEAPASP